MTTQIYEEERPLLLKVKSFNRYTAPDKYVSYQLYLVDSNGFDYSLRISKSLILRFIEDLLTEEEV